MLTETHTTYQQYDIDERSFTIRPDTTDKLVVDEIWKGKIYEFLQPQAGDLIIDIGGHIGVAAAWFAHHGAQVHTFEPIDDNYRLLVENTQGYDNVTSYNLPVMYRDGWVLLGKHPQRDNHHASYSVIYGQQQPEIANVAVSLARVFGSPFVKSHNGPIKIKLDTEGAEYDHLLSGPTPWLDSVERMIIEFHIFTRQMEPLYDKAIDHLRTHFDNVRHSLEGETGYRMLSYAKCERS